MLLLLWVGGEGEGEKTITAKSNNLAGNRAEEKTRERKLDGTESQRGRTISDDDNLKNSEAGRTMVPKA